MRVKCHSCAAGYTLPESKLRAGRKLQFSCRRCGARIQVEVPEQGQDGADTELARSRLGSSLSGLSERPRFAPAVKDGAQPASTGARRRVSGTQRQAPSAPSEPVVRNEDALTAVPAARESTDAVRQREESRLQDSVTATRSEQAVRWFVANEDGSYKKWRGADLEVAINGGLVGAETLVWRKGMAEWLPADETDEWRALYEQRGDAKPAAPEPPAEREAAEEAVEPTQAMSTLDAADSAGHATVADSHDPVAADDAAATVAGTSRPATDQRAVSLPIVRPRSGQRSPRRERSTGRAMADTHQPATHEPAAGASGFADDRSGGTPIDPGAGGQDKRWAPATDTYTGPRGRFTHRIGSESERAALLAHVDREQNLNRALRRWQWIALGTAGAALIAFMLAFYALIGWQGAAERAADRVVTESRK